MMLNDADTKRIEATIAELEESTAGELVLVVAQRSDDYDLWRGIPAVGLAMLCAAGVSELWPDFSPIWILGAQVPLILVFWWGFGRAAVLRRLVPTSVQAGAVDARAKQVFLDRGLTETRDRSGVLLFLSELEHRVQIVADRGIHDRVGVENWQEDIQLIIEYVRRGQAGDGICLVLRRIGEQLASAFPPRADDVNEMSNAVQRME